MTGDRPTLILAGLGLFLLLSQAEEPNPSDQADSRDPTAHAEEEGKPSLYHHAYRRP